MDKDTSVKVAVRIRPLSSEEAIHEPVLCLDTIPEGSQVIPLPDESRHPRFNFPPLVVSVDCCWKRHILYI